MKRETQLDKLNALLGISKKAEEVKIKSTGNTVGITEDKIQKWREIQGVIYFLQAPALFSPKTCTNCGMKFTVSRLFVSCCSYDCITESLRKIGITWEKGSNLESLALDPQVYDGNEPLWVRQPTLLRLQEILHELLNPETDASLTKTSESELIGSDTSTKMQKIPSITSPTTPTIQTTTSESRESTSLAPSPTSHPSKPITKSSTTNASKQRRISFG